MQESHSLITLQHWRDLVKTVKASKVETGLNGRGLSIATIVAVARYLVACLSFILEEKICADAGKRYGASAHLDASSVARIDEGAKAIARSLAGGGIIYGECASRLRFLF